MISALALLAANAPTLMPADYVDTLAKSNPQTAHVARIFVEGCLMDRFVAPEPSRDILEQARRNDGISKRTRITVAKRISDSRRADFYRYEYGDPEFDWTSTCTVRVSSMDMPTAWAIVTAAMNDGRSLAYPSDKIAFSIDEPSRLYKVEMDRQSLSLKRYAEKIAQRQIVRNGTLEIVVRSFETEGQQPKASDGGWHREFSYPGKAIGLSVIP